MATHHRTQIIAPFPEHIDREKFAMWISGFTDGEGCFVLFMQPRDGYPCPSISFEINLRADDYECIKLIQSFWQCGRARIFKPSPNELKGASLKAGIQISRTRDLHNIIVPHFVAHPLFAKKSRDFAIWRTAVELKARVLSRKITVLGTGKWSRARWTDRELTQFSALVEQLKEVRKFRDPRDSPTETSKLPVPEENPPPSTRQAFLF